MTGNPEMTNENIALSSDRSELYEGSPRSKGKNADGTSMELLMDVPQVLIGDMGVDLRGRHVLVAQKLLDAA